MSTAIALQSNKAARGTKRVCQACAVRFYDLMRAPIVCPACGEQHTPMAQVDVLGSRAVPAGGKTTWRRNTKRPGPVLPQPDPEAVTPVEAVADDEIEVASEDAAEPVADDDTVVLEQEPDDGDVSGLVGLDVEEPKER